MPKRPFKFPRQAGGAPRGRRRARAARAGAGAETREARGGGGLPTGCRPRRVEGGRTRTDSKPRSRPCACARASGPGAAPAGPRPLPRAPFLPPPPRRTPCPFLRPVCDLLRPTPSPPSLPRASSPVEGVVVPPAPATIGARGETGRWRSQQHHRLSRGREHLGWQHSLGTGWRRGGPPRSERPSGARERKRLSASASRGGIGICSPVVRGIRTAPRRWCGARGV